MQRRIHVPTQPVRPLLRPAGLTAARTSDRLSGLHLQTMMLFQPGSLKRLGKLLHRLSERLSAGARGFGNLQPEPARVPVRNGTDWYAGVSAPEETPILIRGPPPFPGITRNALDLLSGRRRSETYSYDSCEHMGMSLPTY